MFILPGFLSIRALAVAFALVSAVLTAPLPMGINEELIDKIKLQATEIKDEMKLNEETLKMIRTLLNISPLPLEQCKYGSFSRDACYSQLLNGLKTMQSLLGSAHQYKAADLTDLVYDLKEFISNLEEVMTEQSIAIPAHVPQTMRSDISEFQEKAGIFLILHDLLNALRVFQEGLASQSQ